MSTDINPLNAFYPMVKQIITTMGITTLSDDTIRKSKDENAILIMNILNTIEKELDENTKKEFDIFKGIVFIMGYNLSRNEKALKEITNILWEYEHKKTKEKKE